MTHAVIVVLVALGLAVLATACIGLIAHILMRVVLEFANSDVILAKLGLKFLRKNNAIFPGLFPRSTKLVQTSEEVNAELSEPTAEEPKDE